MFCEVQLIRLVGQGRAPLRLEANGVTWDISIGPFNQHGLTLIPAWLSNHMPSKVWDEIIYPFQNFNGATVEV